MKRIDIILTAVAVMLTIFVIIKYPSPRELPEVEAPEAAVLNVSVEEEFIEDVKALPGPAIKEEVKTWQRVEEFTPTDEILLDAADQITLYYLCKQNNVPMAYALAIMESDLEVLQVFLGQNLILNGMRSGALANAECFRSILLTGSILKA